MKFIVKKILWRFYENCETGSGQREFLENNVSKHARILYVLLVAMVLAIIGCYQTNSNDIATVLTATLGPVMILGGAWFAISFGGIPAKLLDAAMDITMWMFSAFMSSLTVAMVAVCFVTSPWLWPIWILVYIGTYVTCVMYDTADGFKAGLDEAVLDHARYAVTAYKKQGIKVGKK